MHWVSGIWWVAAGALLIGELATGTFYLLMVAGGCVAGGLVRVAGGSIELQWAVAAVVAGLAVYLLRRFRPRIERIDPQRNPDMNLDIGATLDIASWRDGAARAVYRGAEWDIELAPGETEHAGRFQIVAVHGSRLVVRESA